MHDIDTLLDAFGGLPNACVLPAGTNIATYVENELIRVIPFIEQDPPYVEFLRQCDALTIGLGDLDNDEIEDEQFCIYAVQELAELADWEVSRFLEIAWGCYPWEIDSNPCEVWYHWGLDVDQPRGVLKMITIDEEIVAGPAPAYDNFLTFLQAALDRQGLPLEFSEQGEPA